LRSFGWNIEDIIRIKLLENITIFVLAFFVGISMGYIYVFILNAPFLNNIFLGYKNLPHNISFVPIINFDILLLLFFLFIVPAIATILVPIWRLSTKDPNKVML
jgi:ABC-type antimicrobial peptide transport system permease subunit